MRTVFYLSTDEYRDIKARGLDLQVHGETFTIMVNGTRKLKPVEDTPQQDGRAKNNGGRKPGTPFPTAYPESFKAKVLKYTLAHGRPEAAKKFKISTTTVRTWIKQKEGK